MKIIILAITLPCLLYSSAGRSDNQQNEDNSAVSNKIICPNNVDKRTIIKTSSSQWCDQTFSDICSKDKMKLARRVCSNTYNAKQAKLSNQQKNQVRSEKKNSLKPNYRATLFAEKKQIEFEQQLLELKQRELDIRKRELELFKKEQALISKS